MVDKFQNLFSLVLLQKITSADAIQSSFAVIVFCDTIDFSGGCAERMFLNVSCDCGEFCAREKSGIVVALSFADKRRRRELSNVGQRALCIRMEAITLETRARMLHFLNVPSVYISSWKGTHACKIS